MSFTGDYQLDTEILLEYIKNLKYNTATARMKKFNIKRSVGGSILYGDTWRSYLSKNKNREYDEKRKKYLTEVKRLNPKLQSVFEEFRDFHFPHFHFTQVQLNKNYKIPRHIDSQNIGESVLVCCGNYKGGLTCIEKENGIEKRDARKQPVIFNGSKYYHYVEDFKGDRFSLVFFDY